MWLVLLTLIICGYLVVGHIREEIAEIKSKKIKEIGTVDNFKKPAEHFGSGNDAFFADEEIVADTSTGTNSALKEQIKTLRKAIIKKELELAEGEMLEKLRNDLAKMEKIISTHLEKGKGDFQTEQNLLKDLRDYYLALHGLKKAWCIHETDLSHEAADNYWKRQDEYIPKKEEMEKKYSEKV